MSEATNPAFEHLLQLEQRCSQSANAVPSLQDRADVWSGVGFRLADQFFLVPLNEIAEVLSMPAVTHVPGALSWMKGVANVRGRLMTVMDLSGYFGLPVQTQFGPRRLLVFDQDDVYTGMAVDEVLGMQHVPEQDFLSRASLPEQMNAITKFVRGAYQKDGQHWLVFSLRALSQDPRFMQVAQVS